MKLSRVIHTMKGLGQLPASGWKVLGMVLVVGILALACGQGSYPLDIFYEMHYQQSYKSHEPPRLSVPESAVPWFPAAQSTSYNSGEHLFTVNCSMCHGPTGKGDGPVLQTLMSKYDYEPLVDPDLTSAAVVALQRQGMMGYMSSGIVVMPSFTKLLTPEEMDSIVNYVMENLQQP